MQHQADGKKNQVKWNMKSDDVLYTLPSQNECVLSRGFEKWAAVRSNRFKNVRKTSCKKNNPVHTFAIDFSCKNKVKNYEAIVHTYIKHGQPVRS